LRKIILIVLNNFQNDSRVLKEAIFLQKAGYKVQVVALNDGFLKNKDVVQGVSVNRISLKTANFPGFKIFKIIKYFEFFCRIVKKYRESDVFHCNDLDALPIGVIIKKFFNKNAKVVYDAHEYETEVRWLKGFQKKIYKIVERLLIGYADKIITVSNAIADEYVKLYNIEKPILVLNTPSLQKIKKSNIFRDVFDIKKQQTIFLYQGGLSKGRGIEILLEAFKSIDDVNTVIVFMGYGPLEKLIKETSKEHENIYFHKAVSPDILLDYTSSADFGVSTIEDSCLSYRYCLPNKMFEYLMAEIPVIVSNLYEMRRLVEKSNVGVVAKENNSKGLKEAIERVMDLEREELMVNIRKMKKVYNWERQEKVLWEIYEDLFK